jgi:hypothetical protein
VDHLDAAGTSPLHLSFGVGCSINKTGGCLLVRTDGETASNLPLLYKAITEPAVMARLASRLPCSMT